MLAGISTFFSYRTPDLMEYNIIIRMSATWHGFTHWEYNNGMEQKCRATMKNQRKTFLPQRANAVKESANEGKWRVETTGKMLAGARKQSIILSSWRGTRFECR